MVISDIYVLFIQAMKSELEKVSPSLGRSAVFSKESSISDLPRQEPHILFLCFACKNDHFF